MSKCSLSHVFNQGENVVGPDEFLALQVESVRCCDGFSVSVWMCVNPAWKKTKLRHKKTLIGTLMVTINAIRVF